MKNMLRFLFLLNECDKEYFGFTSTAWKIWKELYLIQSKNVYMYVFFLKQNITNYKI